MGERRLSEQEADRLAKWRWGTQACARRTAWFDGWSVAIVTDRVADRSWAWPTFEEAFRASMQRPMTDKDAELEAKIRWADGYAYRVRNELCTVGRQRPGGFADRLGEGATWEAAFEKADWHHEEPHVYPAADACRPDPIANRKAAGCLSGHQQCVLCGHGLPTRKTREVTGKVQWVGTADRGQDQMVALSDGSLLCIERWHKEDAGPCTRFDAFKIGDHVRVTLAACAPNERGRVVRVEVCNSGPTLPEAIAESKRRWGPDACAFAAIGDAPCAVGRVGVVWGTGKDFREAFWMASAVPLGRAFAGVARAIQAEENKRVGQALIKCRPDWAYRAGWQYAVMAAVEWLNVDGAAMPEESALPVILKSYHKSRLAGRTPELAIAMINGRDHVREIYRVVCAAYERGRGAPGGGR